MSDPCYSRDSIEHGIMGVIDNVVNGEWTAHITQASDRYVETLEANHIGSSVLAAWEQLPFEVCVDSGQAGIFSEELYPQGDNVGEYDDLNTFYGRACAATYDEKDRTKRFGFIEEGVVSSSGFGDGGYKAFAAKDAYGRVVAVMIEFIGDEDDDCDDMNYHSDEYLDDPDGSPHGGWLDAS